MNHEVPTMLDAESSVQQRRAPESKAARSAGQLLAQEAEWNKELRKALGIGDWARKAHEGVLAIERFLYGGMYRTAVVAESIRDELQADQQIAGFAHVQNREGKRGRGTHVEAVSIGDEKAQRALTAKIELRRLTQEIVLASGKHKRELKKQKRELSREIIKTGLHNVVLDDSIETTAAILAQQKGHFEFLQECIRSGSTREKIEDRLTTVTAESEFARQLQGAGFLTLGPDGHVVPTQQFTDMIQLARIYCDDGRDVPATAEEMAQQLERVHIALSVARRNTDVDAALEAALADNELLRKFKNKHRIIAAVRGTTLAAAGLVVGVIAHEVAAVGGLWWIATGATGLVIRTATSLSHRARFEAAKLANKLRVSDIDGKGMDEIASQQEALSERARKGARVRTGIQALAGAASMVGVGWMTHVGLGILMDTEAGRVVMEHAIRPGGHVLGNVGEGKDRLLQSRLPGQHASHDVVTHGQMIESPTNPTPPDFSGPTHTETIGGHTFDLPEGVHIYPIYHNGVVTTYGVNYVYPDGNHQLDLGTFSASDLQKFDTTHLLHVRGADGTTADLTFGQSQEGSAMFENPIAVQPTSESWNPAEQYNFTDNAVLIPADPIHDIPAHLAFQAGWSDPSGHEQVTDYFLHTSEGKIIDIKLGDIGADGQFHYYDYVHTDGAGHYTFTWDPTSNEALHLNLGTGQIETAGQAIAQQQVTMQQLGYLYGLDKPGFLEALQAHGGGSETMDSASRGLTMQASFGIATQGPNGEISITNYATIQGNSPIPTSIDNGQFVLGNPDNLRTLWNAAMNNQNQPPAGGVEIPGGPLEPVHPSGSTSETWQQVVLQEIERRLREKHTVPLIPLELVLAGTGLIIAGLTVPKNNQPTQNSISGKTTQPLPTNPVASQTTPPAAGTGQQIIASRPIPSLTPSQQRQNAAQVNAGWQTASTPVPLGQRLRYPRQLLRDILAGMPWNRATNGPTVSNAPQPAANNSTSSSVPTSTVVPVPPTQTNTTQASSYQSQPNLADNVLRAASLAEIEPIMFDIANGALQLTPLERNQVLSAYALRVNNFTRSEEQNIPPSDETMHLRLEAKYRRNLGYLASQDSNWPRVSRETLRRIYERAFPLT